MADPRYRTARWRRLRARAITRDGGRCSIPGCKNNMAGKGQTFVDHIREVRDGGPFWDLTNLQTLCKPHHDAKTLAVKADRSMEPQSPNA